LAHPSDSWSLLRLLLSSLWLQGTQAESAIKKYGDKEIHWSMQGMLRLMPAAMMRLFQPTLDNIKNAISQVLASPDVSGLQLGCLFAEI